MAAYAAVISLKQTINSLLLDSSRISSLVSSTREMLQVAYNETTSLQHVLEKLNDSSKKSSKRLDALEAQIRDCANQLEDVLEFHELDLPDEAVMRQEITSFGEAVKEMEKDYIYELSKPEEEDEDNDDDVSSNIDFGVEMVGYSDDFNAMESRLRDKMRPDDLIFFSLSGKHGCGKTAAAKTVFEEEVRDFDYSVWVTIGAEHQTKQVLKRIIDQVEDESNQNNNIEEEDKDDDERSISELSDYLYLLLKQRRYMIVLDNVRDVEVVECLKRSLPDESNGSIVIITTNLEEVAQLTDILGSVEFPFHYFCGLLWSSLRMIFDWEEIPPELEEAGKKIIENCGCLLISAAKTLLFLIRTEKR